MRTVGRGRLNPNRARDQQAVALWIEAALGSDPILIGGRSDMRIDLISRSIGEVDELSASDARAREQCETALRHARDGVVQGLVGTVLGGRPAEDFFELCSQVAGDLEDSIGEVWEELLSFYDGLDLVSQIMKLAHEQVVGLFPDREGEIDALYSDFDCLIEAWRWQAAA